MAGLVSEKISHYAVQSWKSSEMHGWLTMRYFCRGETWTWVSGETELLLLKQQLCIFLFFFLFLFSFGAVPTWVFASCPRFFFFHQVLLGTLQGFWRAWKKWGTSQLGSWVQGERSIPGQSAVPSAWGNPKFPIGTSWLSVQQAIQ